MFCRTLAIAALVAAVSASNATQGLEVHPVLRGHHFHSAQPAEAAFAASANSALATGASKQEAAAQSGGRIMAKLKALEAKVAAQAGGAPGGPIKVGKLLVNGPLPDDFEPLFADSVADATGCDPDDVRVVHSSPARGSNAGLVQVMFEAPEDVVEEVREQASIPDSALATGELRPFLVAKESAAAPGPAHRAAAAHPAKAGHHAEALHAPEAGAMHGDVAHPVRAAPRGRIDIDASLPYGDLEPFGREDTAQELTETSVKESDDMIDQLERAEVAEEKRSVFRALTRLRGVAIASFDAVAKSQTNNVDHYSQTHKWRQEHPLHHLADEEADVKTWAFPKSADY